MNHYGKGVQLTINYQSLHNYLPSSQIMGCMKPIMIRSEWVKIMLPEGNRLKDNFDTVKSIMKPLDQG